MSKDKLKKMIFVLILLAFFCIEKNHAQESDKEKGQTFIMLSDNREKITDLTDEIKKNCSNSIRRTVRENFIELKFQPKFANEAENLADELEKMLNEVQNILFPLKVNNLRLYLYQRDEVPINYQMTDKWRNENFYFHLIVFKDKKLLNWGECKDNLICLGVFETIPHELTHTATSDLITEKRNRWFDDGLAEYVANEVLEKFSPNEYRKKIESYIPAVSLFRNDIRQNIFSWREPSVGFSLQADYKEISNEIFKYGASYQIFKQIVIESEKTGLKNPLNILLTKLKERREKLGKPADSKEIISLIQQNLKVNPKTLGILDEQTQKNFVNEALKILSQNEISVEKKNYALYILAGIDDTQLSENWMKYLLDEIYQRKSGDENQRELAATALAIRFNNEGFDKILEHYLEENKELKGKSIKKLKRELQELSIRPPVK